MQLTSLSLALTRMQYRFGGIGAPYLLKEDTGALLLENGGFILLE